jgi:hypothetical protein
MKHGFILAIVVFSLVDVPVVSGQADVAGATSASNANLSTSRVVDNVVRRDVDSAVHELIHASPDAHGNTAYYTNRYTTLATGMNVEQGDGSFVPASTDIEVQPDGTGAATKTRHKLYLNADVTDPNGLVRIVGPAPDNFQFVARPVCISYWDSKSGKSVLIGEFRSSIGTVAPGANKVVYEDCCADFKCNLIIQNTLSGVESWVELVEDPPAPSSFGLDDGSTRLELVTEFLNPPQPAKSTVVDTGVPDDLTLHWGKRLRMPSGVAFRMGDNNSIHVHKQWMNMDGRQCLIESVDYSLAKIALQKLPAANQASIDLRKRNRHVAMFKRELPKHRALSSPLTTQLQIAKTVPPNTGFLVDYSIVASGGPFTFMSGQTYFVTNSVSLVGTTVLEGGAIIKYSTNTDAQISISALDCRTAPYAPAIFTSMNDNSVGDVIAGSTGNPWTNYCGAAALYTDAPDDCAFHDVRFCHLNAGFACPDEIVTSGFINATNLQVVHCNYAFRSDCITTVQNSLFDSVNTLFGMGLPHGNAAGATFIGENMTVHHCGTFAVDNTGAFYFTNCLLVQTGPFTTYFPSEMHTNKVVLLSDDTGVFKTVGAGNHYLADASPFRSAGTTNDVDPSLLSMLQNKTTYAPVVLTNIEYSDVTIMPQVPRDSSGLGIGYHYEPIDCITWGYTVTNSTLTITNGAVIGYYQDPGTVITDGARIISQGSPKYPNRFVSYLTVQEQSTSIGSGTGAGIPIKPYRSSGVGLPAVFRFTQFNRICVGATNYDLNLDVSTNQLFTTLELKDCGFTGGGSLNFTAGSVSQIGITNTLFERENLSFSNSVTSGYKVSLQNSLMYGGAYSANAPSSSWLIRDNIFDNAMLIETAGASTHDHNAYINSSTNDFPVNTGDIPLSSFNYSVGPLGNYYQPTNSPLLNCGSQSAASAGLFHYTVLTNEVKETTNQVSIGLHYVALDPNGTPIDYDGDGVHDYAEDANGNGTVDSGETDWQSASDLGLKVQITRPQNNSKLP